MTESTGSISEPAADPSSDNGGARDEQVEAPELRVVDKRWWARETDDASEDSSNADTQPAYVEELEHKLAEKDSQLSKYVEKYKDAAQEFDQSRDRQRREFAKDVDRETRGVLYSFLEVVDNLDRAITAAEENSTHTGALLEGVQLVRDQFLTILKRNGVTQLEANSKPFDPNLHDALSTVAVTDPAQDNTIVTVVKPGYLVNDNILRPASVTVGSYES